MRQLRDVARNIGVSRYSAQDREGLAEAISRSAADRVAEAAEVAEVAEAQGAIESSRAIEAEMAPASRPTAETRVVFLPRDPQWAYV
ncbi:MAG: DUF4912 domain-containing protein, partial [Synechococcaceae cyanobacterium ELA182]